jgi:hypothetical protein
MTKLILKVTSLKLLLIHSPRFKKFPKFSILALSLYSSLKIGDKVSRPSSGNAIKLKFCITSSNLYAFRQQRGRRETVYRIAESFTPEGETQAGRENKQKLSCIRKKK